MRKKPLLFIAYTLFIIVISSFITTAYFHVFVLNNTSPEQKSLILVGDSDVKKSPIKEDNTIVEIFSYGCHYCALNEENVAKLEARMPVGSKLIRLHITNQQMKGLARFSPLFATLTVMGIEPQQRHNAYNAIIKEKNNLSDPKNRDNWLKENGIDPDVYAEVSQTQQVKELLDYMREVARHYNINATPIFIVKKKWVALQDRDFSAFSDHLLSLLQHDKPLEQ